MKSLCRKHFPNELIQVELQFKETGQASTKGNADVDEEEEEELEEEEDSD